MENRASESYKSLRSDHRKHRATGTQKRTQVPRGQGWRLTKRAEKQSGGRVRKKRDWGNGSTRECNSDRGTRETGTR